MAYPPGKGCNSLNGLCPLTAYTGCFVGLSWRGSISANKILHPCKCCLTLKAGDM